MHCAYVRKCIRIDLNGDLSPCCDFNQKSDYNLKTTINDYLNSPFLTDLELKLSNNQWPEGCTICKQKEEKNILSLRQLGSINLKKFLDEEQLMLDIKLDDHCNSDCVMCTPQFSTKIQSRLKKFPIDKKFVNNFDLMNNDKKWIDYNICWEKLGSLIDKVGYLKILGGEPFLNKKVWNWFLTDKVQKYKKNITLHITTNMSHLDLRYYELLSNWKNLVIVASVDSVDEQYEWIRTGLKWKTVEKNIKKIKKIENCYLTVHATVGLFSIATIDQLINWINHEDEKILFSYELITTPKFQSIKYVSPLTLQNTLNSLQHIKCKNIKNQILLNNLKKEIQYNIDNNEYDENKKIVKELINYYNNHRQGIMCDKTLKIINER